MAPQSGPADELPRETLPGDEMAGARGVDGGLQLLLRVRDELVRPPGSGGTGTAPPRESENATSR